MSRLLSLEEIVEQTAVKRNASEEQKAEFYKKAKLVREKARQIDWFLSLMVDPEKVSRMKLLEVLSDGKPKTWGQAEKETGLSPTTLSKALKRMAKEGWVTRKVKKTFPPRSVYQVHEWVVEVGKFFQATRKILEGNLFKTMVENYSEEDYERIVEGVRQGMFANLNTEMAYCLKAFINSDYKAQETMVFLTTISQLMFFWSSFLILTQNKEIAGIALEILAKHEKTLWEEAEEAGKVWLFK